MSSNFAFHFSFFISNNSFQLCNFKMAQPTLFRNVKAKEPENPLESTMVEVEEKEKENNARLSLLPQCPLPSAVYKVTTCRLSTLVLILSPGQFRGGRKGGARQGERRVRVRH